MRRSSLKLGVIAALVLAPTWLWLMRPEATQVDGAPPGAHALDGTQDEREASAFLPLAANAFDLDAAATAVPAAPTATSTTPQPATSTAPPTATSDPAPACPLPTWPAPTHTPLPPLPGSTHPSSKLSAVLELADGRRLTAVVDPSCDPDECDDAEIMTPNQPIVVTSPARLRLHLAAAELPSDLMMHVFPETSVRSRDEDSRGTISWVAEPIAVQTYAMLLRRQQDVVLARPPGRYIVAIYAEWSEDMEPNFGFYLEVQP